MHALAVLYPGCVEFEIALAIELVGRAMPVRVATADGRAHISASGVRWEADGTYAASHGAGCVLVPGGDPGSVIEDASLRGLLVEAAGRGAIIGAICAGPVLLGRAGVLAGPAGGRRFTHGYGAAQMPFVGRYFEGACAVDAMVVRDGPIITARAQGFVGFAVEVARACGALDGAAGGTEAEAARLVGFYGGGVADGASGGRSA